MSSKINNSEHCTCGLAKDCRLEAYNEEAFWYLLRVERRRSERSRRPFLLILVDLGNEARGRGRIPSTLADKVFSGLSRVLRETDVIGWYREEQMAGAMLSGQDAASLTELSARITARVTDALSGSLPAPTSRDLQVHAYQIQPTLAN